MARLNDHHYSVPTWLSHEFDYGLLVIGDCAIDRIGKSASAWLPRTECVGVETDRSGLKVAMV
jgi:hypothetical protein